MVIQCSLHFSFSFQSCECDVHRGLLISWFLLVFLQIDRVVEELENRPELQHVVKTSISYWFHFELDKVSAGHISYRLPLL